MLAIILAICSGAMIITTKYINNASVEKLGLLPGSVINYIVGSIFAFTLTLIMAEKGLALSNLQIIPSYLFLGGVLGLLAMIISNQTMNKLPVLHSTSLIISAQMITAIVIDIIMFNQFSLFKIVGAAIVVVSLIWDQRIIRECQKNIKD